MGIVNKLKRHALRREEIEEGGFPDRVLKKFDDNKTGSRRKDEDICVAIAPAVVTFQVKEEYRDFQRQKLLLIISWAIKV